MTVKMIARMFAAFVAGISCKRDEPVVAARTAEDTGLVATEAVNGIVSNIEGTIRAPAPVGEGWECFRQEKADAGTSESLVQCWRRGSPADFVLTLAKSYVVPSSEVMTAEALAKGPYREGNEGQFSEVRYVQQTPVDHRGRPAYESHLVGVHASAGPVKKRERVLTSGNRVFILQAEGNPDALERHGGVVADWFARTEFVQLGQ